MKAVCVRLFGGPDVLKVEDVSVPAPAAGQVLVKIHAAGVNPVDVYVRAGNYGPRPFPFTPGFDAAGVVEAAGRGVKGLKPGMRVYLDGSLTGAYATHALCNAEHVHPLPKTLSFAEGAGIGVPYLTAARALFQKAHAKKGERVLVHGGSGGVGIAAIQLAASAGLTVFATAGTERGRELVKRQGAKHVLDHGNPRYQNELMDMTRGDGVNVILEMLANVNLGKDLTLLARGGRVVVIGSRGPVEVNPRDAMSRDASVFGMSLFNCPARERTALHKRLAPGLKRGSLRPVIGRELPLHEAPKAHDAVMEKGAFGKIVLIP